MIVFNSLFQMLAPRYSHWLFPALGRLGCWWTPSICVPVSPPTPSLRVKHERSVGLGLGLQRLAKEVEGEALFRALRRGRGVASGRGPGLRLLISPSGGPRCHLLQQAQQLTGGSCRQPWARVSTVLTFSHFFGVWLYCFLLGCIKTVLPTFHWLLLAI